MKVSLPPFLESRVTVLDPDRSRGLAVAICLAPLAKEVVGHQGFEELLARWPTTGIVAVADCGSLVAEVQDAMRTIRNWRAHIIYGEEPDASAVADAILGGATDYVAWPSTHHAIARRAAAWPARSVEICRRAQQKQRAQRLIAKLSKRQTEILELMADGLTSDQIAGILKLGTKTIGAHRYRMFKTLEVDGLAKAVRLLLEATL